MEGRAAGETGTTDVSDVGSAAGASTAGWTGAGSAGCHTIGSLGSVTEGLQAGSRCSSMAMRSSGVVTLHVAIQQYSATS